MNGVKYCPHLEATRWQHKATNQEQASMLRPVASGSGRHHACSPGVEPPVSLRIFLSIRDSSRARERKLEAKRITEGSFQIPPETIETVWGVDKAGVLQLLEDPRSWV